MRMETVEGPAKTKDDCDHGNAHLDKVHFILNFNVSLAKSNRQFLDYLSYRAIFWFQMWKVFH